MRRRHWLGGATALLLAPLGGYASAGRTTRLAAAWDDPGGRHFVGLVDTPADARGRMAVRQAVEVPTRAHGLVERPDGAIVAFARRPGEWMLLLHPGRPADTLWRWSAPDRRCCGHGVFDSDGALWCTETDLDSGAGLLVRRDARSLEVRDELPTHGIDPHELLLEADGSLLVANGGVPTRPETGRVKLDRAAMDSSLVRLRPSAGAHALQDQWRLPDARLSLRHMARHASGIVGIALQAEHDDAEVRVAAPLLALFDGERLTIAPAGRPLAGYAGDIAATPSGFALAATRAGRVVLHAVDGRPQHDFALPDACPLASAGAVLWAGGSGRARCADAGATTYDIATGPLRLDNHWIRPSHRT